ncbi:hypothetical protein M0813_14234 [Anaeramoeba flamelloides]|uniref:Uncharacterized protein n=1 Tax=Anaeramoeba flamelloides TaxID=1746091 RepID=A0ABQ8Z661_9EUKA|nr:hypothetical protein M0813_14234 [Anaeramoeba flamelloides]
MSEKEQIIEKKEKSAIDNYIQKTEKQNFAIVFLNQSQEIISFNKQAIDDFKCESTSIENLSFDQFCSENQYQTKVEPNEFLKEHFKHIVKERSVISEFVCNFKTKDSTTFWGSVFVLKLRYQKEILFQLVILKIDQPEIFFESSKTDLKTFLQQEKEEPKPFFFEDFDMEEKFEKENNAMKILSRSLIKNPIFVNLYKKIAALETSFQNEINDKNLEIQKMIQLVHKKRNVHKDKIQTLEIHLERRINEFESEKKTFDKLESDNKLYNSKLEVLKMLLMNHSEEKNRTLNILKSKTLIELTMVMLDKPSALDVLKN